MKTQNLFLALAICSSLFCLGGNRAQAAEPLQMEQNQDMHTYYFDVPISRDAYLTILAPEARGSHWELESTDFGFEFENCDYSQPGINTIYCWAGFRGRFHVILDASGNHKEKAELYVSALKY